jgi:hypothetical protein
VDYVGTAGEFSKNDKVAVTLRSNTATQVAGTNSQILSIAAGAQTGKGWGNALTPNLEALGFTYDFKAPYTTVEEVAVGGKGNAVWSAINVVKAGTKTVTVSAYNYPTNAKDTAAARSYQSILAGGETTYINKTYTDVLAKNKKLLTNTKTNQKLYLDSFGNILGGFTDITVVRYAYVYNVAANLSGWNTQIDLIYQDGTQAVNETQLKLYTDIDNPANVTFGNQILFETGMIIKLDGNGNAEPVPWTGGTTAGGTTSALLAATGLPTVTGGLIWSRYGGAYTAINNADDFQDDMLTTDRYYYYTDNGYLVAIIAEPATVFSTMTVPHAPPVRLYTYTPIDDASFGLTFRGGAIAGSGVTPLGNRLVVGGTHTVLFGSLGGGAIVQPSTATNVVDIPDALDLRVEHQLTFTGEGNFSDATYYLTRNSILDFAGNNPKYTAAAVTAAAAEGFRGTTYDGTAFTGATNTVYGWSVFLTGGPAIFDIDELTARLVSREIEAEAGATFRLTAGQLGELFYKNDPDLTTAPVDFIDSADETSTAGDTVLSGAAYDVYTITVLKYAVVDATRADVVLQLVGLNSKTNSSIRAIADTAYDGGQALSGYGGLKDTLLWTKN